jgi:hypothetical protein
MKSVEMVMYVYYCIIFVYPEKLDGSIIGWRVYCARHHVPI